MTPHASARLRVLGAALLFSTGGSVIKFCALTSWQVAGFRSAVAALAVFVMLPGARRFWHPRALLVGMVYAACLILFVSANKTTTALNTIYLQSTAPLYMLLLSPWLLHEPIRRRDLLFMAALGVGMSILLLGSEPERTTAPNPVLGNLLAAGSGVCWAGTVVGLRFMAREGAGRGASAGAAVVAGNLGAFLFCLPWALRAGGGRLVDWVAIVYLGVFQIGVAYVFLTAAMRKVPALEAALLLLIEPVLNPVWAWLFQGEAPGRAALLGSAIILLGTLVHALQPAGAPGARRASRSPDPRPPEGRR